jgi:hypothetical protein
VGFWLYLPILSVRYDFSALEAIEIQTKLGMKSVDPGVGRMVCHPLYLVRTGGGLMMLKPCPWVSEARFIAEELFRLTSLPVRDESGEPEDPDETVY